MQFTLTSNEYIIIPVTDKYLRYWADKDEPWTIYWVHYTGEHINSFNKALRLTSTNRPRKIGYNEKGIELWKSIYEILSDGFSSDNLCCANFTLYHLVGTFLFFNGNKADQDSNAEMVHQTVDYIRNSLYGKLTAVDMSNINHLSVSHFTLLFKKTTGMSPIAYFNQLKMQKAAELLFSSNDHINSIAKKLGYDDPYYFSRLFKNIFGSSPAGYRSLSRDL